VLAWIRAQGVYQYQHVELEVHPSRLVPTVIPSAYVKELLTSENTDPPLSPPHAREFITRVMQTSVTGPKELLKMTFSQMTPTGPRVHPVVRPTLSTKSPLNAVLGPTIGQVPTTVMDPPALFMPTDCVFAIALL
jgi:hypothetical protein